jgi:type IX secretion system PorP/SprF family membrane protein
MKKRVLLIAGFLCLLPLIDCYGQQDPQYTQYMYNMNVVNPAYAGSKENLSFGLLYRKQWVNLDGSPTTVTFSGHAPMKKNIGIGLSIINDKLGPVSESNVYADISYTIKLSKEQKLAFGIKSGATFHKIDYQTIYPTLVHQDDLFGQPNPNSIKLNFGVGMFYYTDKYYLSIAMPNLLRTAYFDFNGVSYGSEVPHFFIMGGYVFQLNESLKFKPSIMLKSALEVPVSYDVSANFLYNERFEIGATYRREDSFGIMTNFKINKSLRIGYAYDNIISDLRISTSSSHEIMILFDVFSYNKVPQSSRFF